MTELKRPEHEEHTDYSRYGEVNRTFEFYDMDKMDSFLLQIADKLEEARRARTGIIRCEIKTGWMNAGKKGSVLGDNIRVEQDWTPVLWDDEDDPTFDKTRSLDFIYPKADAIEEEVIKALRGE